MFATVLEKLPLDVFSSLTDRYHPASTSLFLTLDSWLVLWESRRIWATFQLQLVPRTSVSVDEGGREDSDVGTTV